MKLILRNFKKQAVKLNFLLVFCIAISLSQPVFAQSSSDSIYQHFNLNEVKIEEKKDANSFNFYKGNALASTEEILSRMPGVNLTKRGAFGQEPGLRAYSGTQVNLTINGMKMYGACTDKMDPVSIYVEPNNLKEFSVNQGVLGSSMGNSIGGSIDMKLAEPDFNNSKPINVKWSNTYQSNNNSINESLVLSGNFKKFSYRVSGVYRKADNYKTGSSQVIPFSYFTKYNTSINLAYQLNHKHLIKLDYLGDWGRDIGFPALTMDVGIANAGIYSISHHFYCDDYKYLKSSLSRVYFNKIYHEMDDTKRPDVPIHMDMPGWSETIGAFNESKFELGKYELETRLDAHKVFLRADMIMYPKNEPEMYMQTLPSHEIRNVGLFAKLKRSLGLKNHLTLYGRLDHYQSFVFQGFGADQLLAMNMNISKGIENQLKSFGLTWNHTFSKKWNSELQLSSGERLASSNERFGFYLYNRFDGFDYIGNVQLKNEKSKQAEIAFNYIGNKISWNNRVFYHHNPDAIYAIVLPGYSVMTIGAKGVKSFINLDYANFMGIETAFKYHIIDGLKYMGTIRYTYSENSLGKAMPLTPPLKLQQCLQWIYNSNNIQLESDLASAQNRVNSDFLEKETPAYSLINLRFSRNFNVKKVNLQMMVAVENLFNEDYYEHLDIMKIARPGRNWILGLNLSY
jgi:iron complex outermembrane receptor protein